MKLENVHLVEIIFFRARV